jgi:hypothetical protein
MDADYDKASEAVKTAEKALDDYLSEFRKK